MKILLIKPEIVGIFSYTRLMDHEPLELEYLYTVLTVEGHKAYIYDRRYEKTSLKKKLIKERPDIVAITGSVTQENIMKKIAVEVKKHDKSITVVVGGTHVELNYENFYLDYIDFICHTGDLDSFVKIISFLQKKNSKLSDIKGIAYKEGQSWVLTPKCIADPNDLPVPDREYFEKNRHLFRYLDYKTLALVKTAYSCPYKCSFCYCTNLNSGKYLTRDIDRVVDEIEGISAPYIHIVDDDFLVDTKRIKDFIRLVREKRIQKKYLIYGRADFIANNEAIMKELKEIGLCLVMVGLEAMDDRQLNRYHKKTKSRDNERAVEVLNSLGVECAALLIVNQDSTKEDFVNIYKWVKKVKLMNVTVSIFTPMKGSRDYDQYKDEIVDRRVIRQDLFHLIIKPKNMGRSMFYIRYYILLIKLFINGKSNDRVYDAVNVEFILKLVGILAMKIIRRVRL
ncbi:MAG TPA: radical SAM protein [Pseudobacteroides sp.]|uniref:B12-binding domain-containing radical SAM protein n=1 Tax=Pseudobacteroides sp. TaxID=1968840 RepID=UPI002F91F422